MEARSCVDDFFPVKSPVMSKTRLPTVSGALAAACVARMQEKSESVNQLALASGVSQPALSRWLNGERDIRLQTADRLAALLGLSLARRETSATGVRPARGRAKRKRA